MTTHRTNNPRKLFRGAGALVGASAGVGLATFGFGASANSVTTQHNSPARAALPRVRR
jgi:hypothetical protein